MGTEADRVLDEEPTCLEAGRGDCEGAVEYRFPLSDSGRAFPRCDRHWIKRLEFQEEHNKKYPTLAPADFDPMDAGERWDEE